LTTVKVLLTKEQGTEDLPTPSYQTQGSSGVDLCAANPEPILLEPGNSKLISTGLSISLPDGYEAQVRPRSGLALKHGLTVLNSPGTIDSDYRGLICVILINLGNKSFQVTRGLRLAQLVIQSVIRAEFEVVAKLDETVRAAGGFGHTGA
jgi:dUTP pyrophosphatase